jgi:hypothetical protein
MGAAWAHHVDALLASGWERSGRRDPGIQEGNGQCDWRRRPLRVLDQDANPEAVCNGRQCNKAYQ